MLPSRWWRKMYIYYLVKLAKLISAVYNLQYDDIRNVADSTNLMQTRSSITIEWFCDLLLSRVIINSSRQFVCCLIKVNVDWALFDSHRCCYYETRWCNTGQYDFPICHLAPKGGARWRLLLVILAGILIL